MKNRKKDLRHFAAYHGGSWRPRIQSHHQECGRPEPWPFSGLNSEDRPLKEVLLCRPPRRAPHVANPERVQHLRGLNWIQLRKELAAMGRTLETLGIAVRWQESDWFARPKPNLMFVRDQFFMTSWGAILARMATPVRAGEEKWAQLSLAHAGIPILGFVQGRGTFEGADALWLNPRTVLVGVGNRTNREGFLQVKRILDRYHVRAIPIRMPKKVQHLLGVLQICGPRRALLRVQLAGGKLLQVLSENKFAIIPVRESDEVIRRQGMNILVLAPGVLLMPRNCPDLKSQFERSGLRVAAEVEIRQLLNAAGGLACATAPLARSPR